MQAPQPQGQTSQAPRRQQCQQGELPAFVDQPDQRRHLGEAHAQPQSAAGNTDHSIRPIALNIHITLKKARLTDGTANSQ